MGRGRASSSSSSESEEEGSAALAKDGEPEHNAYGLMADAMFQEELLGKGYLGRKARKTMLEHFWLSHDQRDPPWSPPRGPSLQGSKIFWSVRGQEIKGNGKELLDSLHNGIKAL